MRFTSTIRPVPTRDNYIQVEIENRDEGTRKHWFRIPNIATCARLASIVALAHVVRKGNNNLRTSTITEEAACAVIGVCWWHPVILLDTDWRQFENLSDFGALIWEELSLGIAEVKPEVNAEGKVINGPRPEWKPYTEKMVGEMFSAIIGPIMDMIIPEKEVTEKANFTETPTKED